MSTELDLGCFGHFFGYPRGPARSRPVPPTPRWTPIFQPGRGTPQGSPSENPWFGFRNHVGCGSETARCIPPPAGPGHSPANDRQVPRPGAFPLRCKARIAFQAWSHPTPCAVILPSPSNHNYPQGSLCEWCPLSVFVKNKYFSPHRISSSLPMLTRHATTFQFFIMLFPLCFIYCFFCFF